MKEIRTSGLVTMLYNPFAASAEELLAAALDEAGLLGGETTINGSPADEFLQEYFRKRALYKEVTRLGSILVQRGILSEKDLQRAVDLQRSRGGGIRLGEALVDLGICTMDEIARNLDAQLQIREDLRDLEECRKKVNSIKERIRQYF